MLLKHLAADHHVLQICLMGSTEANKHHMIDGFQPRPILEQNVIKLVLDWVPKPTYLVLVHFVADVEPKTCHEPCLKFQA